MWKKSLLITTMVLHVQLLLLLSLSWSIVPVRSITQIANDPPSYFGGSDHQDYLDWVATVTGQYDNSLYVPSAGDDSKGAAIHWTIDSANGYLHIAVAAPAMGWVGFGITEAGGMLGSDMAIFVKNEPTEIIDAHVVTLRFPQVDDCPDWILDGYFASDEASSTRKFLIFQGHRKLDTGDNQDKKLIPDAALTLPATRIIAAWGDSDSYSYHGPNVVRGALRFYDGQQTEEEAFNEAMADGGSEGSFFIGASNYVIPSNTDTTYKNFCFTKDDIIAMTGADPDTPLSLVGFRPIIDDGPSKEFVHHFIVDGLSSASSLACNVETSFTMVYGWAPGDLPQYLPENIGMPMFGTDGFNGFNIEIHYNNAALTSGVVDSSGVEMYFTSEVREIEMGVLQVGDPFVVLDGQSVGDGISKHTFECPGTCSQTFLGAPGESVTVARESMHMHRTGTRMVNEQIRNGVTIRSSTVEVYDFDQSGNAAVQEEPFDVQFGDSFRTTCYFENADNSQVFGLGSDDEMCIAFLYYYPRKSISAFGFDLPWLCGPGLAFLGGGVCEATYDGESDIGTSGLDRTFGEAGTCQATPGPTPAPTTPSPVTPEPTTPAPVGTPVYEEVKIRNGSFERPGRWKIVQGNPVRDCMSGMAPFRYCHFVFDGEVDGTTSQRIKYTVKDLPEGQPGGKMFMLTFWLGGESMEQKNHFKAFVKMIGDDGTDTQSCKSSKAGTFEYQEMSCTFESVNAFDKMLLVFSYTGMTGKAFLDKVRLYEEM